MLHYWYVAISNIKMDVLHHIRGAMNLLNRTIHPWFSAHLWVMNFQFCS